MMSATIVISIDFLSTLFFQVVYKKKKCWAAWDCAHLLQLIWRIYATPNQSRMPNVDASNLLASTINVVHIVVKKNMKSILISNFYIILYLYHLAKYFTISFIFQFSRKFLVKLQGSRSQQFFCFVLRDHFGAWANSRLLFS